MNAEQFKIEFLAKAGEVDLHRSLISVHMTAMIMLGKPEKNPPNKCPKELEKEIVEQSDLVGEWQTKEMESRKALNELLCWEPDTDAEKEEISLFLRQQCELLHNISGEASKPYSMCDVGADDGKLFKKYWYYITDTCHGNVLWLVLWKLVSKDDSLVLLHQHLAVYALDRLCEHFPEYKEEFLKPDSDFEQFYNRIKGESNEAQRI